MDARISVGTHLVSWCRRKSLMLANLAKIDDRHRARIKEAATWHDEAVSEVGCI